MMTTAPGTREAHPVPGAPHEPLIDAIGVSRSFGAVRALTGVSLEFRAGEVHGLVGANGAGKSTFLNVLAGSFPPSAGTIRVEGREVTIASPRESDRLGFAFMHQELALVPDFSAIDNMTLGIHLRSRLGLASDKARARLARDVADRLGIGFDLKEPVSRLSPAERGLVAIGRALARDARFIAMDEPTASLSDVECARLFRVVRELAQQGVSIAYVSHRLGEIEDLSDRVTVFKDGQVTGRFERGGYTREDLIRGITGTTTPLEEAIRPEPIESDSPVLVSAQHLSDGYRVRDVSFECRAGEILGLAGVVGAGRSETLGLVFGARRAAAGQILLRGTPYTPTSEHDGIAHGIALVPEERRSQALLMDESIVTNIAMGNWRNLRALRGLPFVSDRRADGTAERMLEALRIKASDTKVAVRKLSGGNQQKVVLGRWLARNSTVLLLDEPTRGVDVGARRQIWSAAEEFARAGNAVIVVSSELEELAICHRVVVMVEGRTVGELAGPGVTEEQMLSVIYRQDHEIEGER